MTPPGAEPTTCEEHPLADVRKLTTWHDDQHPELSFLKAVERERRALLAQVKALETERDRLREALLVEMGRARWDDSILAQVNKAYVEQRHD